jgi:undecaprenyl-diphosphatase
VQKIIPMIFLPWGISILLSEWIRRPRPFHSEHYKPLIELAIDTPSFPSQHTTIAFALVAIFLNQPLVWPFMLLAGVLVGLGRLAVGVHYLSDIVVGAIIGFGFAYAMKLAAVLFFV